MYIDGFADIDDIIAQYQAPANALENANILFAKYYHGDYEGSSFVLFYKDGTLYEVNGSHCSCNGLEGQWDPHETSLATLDFRFFSEDREPYWCENNEVDILKTIIFGEIIEEKFFLN